MKLQKVSEDFVQYVWKFGLFDKSNLELTDGSKVQLVKPGLQNDAGGPDFINAKLYINETLWAGTVEIHLTNNDWKAHKHQENEAYNNLILHVVYDDENLEDIELNNGRKVPTLAIGKRIYANTLTNFTSLFDKNIRFIPCEKQVQQVDDFIKTNYLESLLYERLERKVQEVEQELNYAQGDLDKAFLVTLFKYFGAPANKEPFELLARSLTLSQVIKQNISKEQLESFLFGLAGLLETDDIYAQKLANEFAYTSQLYKLTQHCQASQWKFAGVRPPNFPTLRIAQLAGLLYKDVRLFSKLLAMDNLAEIKKLFDVETTNYWDTHYNFGKESTKRKKTLSDSFKDKLLINVIVPFIFFYGKYIQDEAYTDRAIRFLHDIKPEKNSIVSKYSCLMPKAKDAAHTQALLTLYKNYCEKKQCLQCSIGYEVLKPNNV